MVDRRRTMGTIHPLRLQGLGPASRGDGSLVDMLVTAVARAPAVREKLDALRGELTTGDPAGLVEALADRHASAQPGANADDAPVRSPDDAPSAPQPPEGDPTRFSDTVARIREELARDAASAQREHAAVDRAIEGLASRTGTQSETTLLCERRGASGGRLLVANPTPRSVDVSFRVRSADSAWRALPSVAFSPAERTLAPDATATVQLHLELTGEELDPEVARGVLRVDVVAGEEALGVCWVTVRVVDP